MVVIINGYNTPAGVEANLLPGYSGWFEGRGYQAPILENYEGLVKGIPTYKGFKGVSDAMPLRLVTMNTKRTERRELASS